MLLSWLLQPSGAAVGSFESDDNAQQIARPCEKFGGVSGKRLAGDSKVWIVGFLVPELGMVWTRARTDTGTDRQKMGVALPFRPS